MSKATNGAVPRCCLS